jgi:hypothetical protein
LACLYLLRQAFCFFLKKKKAGNAAFASLLVYLLLYSLSWTSSSSIGWMGTPINAIRNLINQSVWNQSIIYAPNFLKNYSTGIYANSRCIIFRVNMSESDLNSRWANALTNPIRMSSECFSGFWNSSSLSSIDLISRLGGLDESYLLVVPLNDMKSLTELSLPKNVVVSTQ